MRIPALTMCAVLAAGAFLSAGASDARADSTSPAVAAQTRTAPLPERTLPAQPGTRAEERDYARREAQAPAEVKKYAGGFVIAVLVIIALVLLIVYLANRT